LATKAKLLNSATAARTRRLRSVSMSIPSRDIGCHQFVE
jgi:hypothetical protein